jgi:proline iminopeptidase
VSGADRWVDTGGVALFVHRDGAGVPMVVLHGGMGIDHRYLRQPLAPLADRAELIFVDQRGNGQSRPADLAAVTMATWADDVVAVIDACRLERAVVFGHSAGGRVALLSALRHPERISGLILCATSAATDHRAATLAAVGARHPTTEQQRGFSDEPFADTADFAAWLRVAFPLYQAPTSNLRFDDLFRGAQFDWPAAWRGSQEAQRFDVRPDLGRIGCPALVLGGRHDIQTPVAEAAEPLAAGLARAQLRIFEFSGHYPFAEEPDAFLHTVCSWLDQENLR